MDLFPLVRAENAEGIRKVLREQPGIDVNVKNEYWACELPKPDIARVLIQAGADLNLTEQHGFTPLHLASWIGNDEMVQLLLEFRADMNRRNNSGSTPIHLAAKNSHVNVLRLLLRQGADRNIRDDKGNMPLDYAKTPEVRSILSAPPEAAASPVRGGRTDSTPPTPTSAPPASPAPASPAPASPATTPQSTSNRGGRAESLTNSAKAAGSDRQPSSTASTREKIEKLQATIKNTSDATVLKKIATVTSDTVLAELHKMDKLNATLAAEQKKSVCLKCTAAPRDTVLIPCMHLAYCAGCVSSMGQACGVCASPIDGRLRVEVPK